MKTKVKMTELERRIIGALHGAVVGAIQVEAGLGGLLETSSPQAIRGQAVRAVARYLATLTAEGHGPDALDELLDAVDYDGRRDALLPVHLGDTLYPAAREAA